MKALLVDNTIIVEANRLRNDITDEWLNEATVELTVTDSSGHELLGPSWPMVMDYVEGTNGSYRAILPADLPVEDEKEYRVRISITSENLKASFNIPVTGRDRDR